MTQENMGAWIFAGWCVLAVALTLRDMWINRRNQKPTKEA